MMLNDADFCKKTFHMENKYYPATIGDENSGTMIIKSPAVLWSC